MTSLATVVLAHFLDVPVHIGHLEISPIANTILVTDFRLDQPDGFGHEPMLSVAKIEITGWRGLVSRERHLEELDLDGVDLNITTARDGHTNLEALGRSDAGDVPEPHRAGEADEPSGIKVDRISISPIRIVRRDDSFEKSPFEVTLEKGRLEILDLTVGSDPDASPGSVTFDGELVQEESIHAFITISARFGPIESGGPPLLGSAGMTGCFYQTFVPAVPAGTDLILGGEGFDLDIDLALSEGRILLVGTTTTSLGGTYSFRVSGSVGEPVIELPEKLAGVAVRMGGGVGRLLNSTFRSGREILVGAVGTAGALGKGALHATGSFLKGIGRMSAGMITFNKDARKKGFDEVTAETGAHLSGALSGSALAIGEAGSRTSNAIRNDPKLRPWIDEIGIRHEGYATLARKEVFEAQFPPEIPGPVKESE